MLDYGIDFVINCNNSGSGHIKKLIDDYSLNLSEGINSKGFSLDPMIKTGVGKELLQNSITIKTQWNYMSTQNKHKTFKQKYKADLYLHIIFSHEIFANSKAKLHHLRNEINDLYKFGVSNGTWDHQDLKKNKDLSAEHLELINKGCIVFDEESKMFNIYPPKANKYLRRSATRVLASNFITDAKFACEVYVAKAGIEQFYNWTKNALEGRTFNVSTDKSLSGKNFILALSTELYWQINHAFRNFRDENGKPLKLIYNSVEQPYEILIVSNLSVCQMSVNLKFQEVLPPIKTLIIKL